MKKKCIIALIGLVAVAVVVGVLYSSDNKETSVGTEQIESTESMIDTIISSFGDEEEVEVENDADPIYDTHGDTSYESSDEESDIPYYMQKLQEEAEANAEPIKEYKEPNFTYSIEDDGEFDAPSKSISECTWYYVEDTQLVTVDGVTADNIPSGMYLCAGEVSGATSLEDAPLIDLSEKNIGRYLGGVNIEPGVYSIKFGYIEPLTSYVGLGVCDGRITVTFQGTCMAPKSDTEPGTIRIYDGSYYQLSECILERVGD